MSETRIVEKYAGLLEPGDRVRLNPVAGQLSNGPFGGYADVESARIAPDHAAVIEVQLSGIRRVVRVAVDDVVATVEKVSA